MKRLKRILCFFGWHDWKMHPKDYYDSGRWGYWIPGERCTRCPAKQPAPKERR